MIVLLLCMTALSVATAFQWFSQYDDAYIYAHKFETFYDYLIVVSLMSLISMTYGKSIYSSE